MINFINKVFDSDNEYCYQFTEKGDVLIISPSTPILGVTQMNQPTFSIVKADGTSGSATISFRYTADSLNWSEWQTLSASTWSDIIFRQKQWFGIEFKIVRTDDVEIYFRGVIMSVTGSVPAEPEFYNKEIKTANKPSYFNPFAIKWALNVLEKVYRRGIVPSFISRLDNHNNEDKDYIDLWWSIIYPAALRISLADEFTDLLWNPRLLAEFLEQRGLVLGNISSIDELYYLMSHFYDELLRRGSYSTFDNSRTVGDFEIRGELARLVDLVEPTDLLARIISVWESSWCLNYTSVCGYENTDKIADYLIGFEKEITDKTKYPLVNADYVTVDTTNHTFGFDGASGRNVGILGDTSSVLSKTLSVSPNRNYVVETELTIDSDVANSVHFQVYGYNSLGQRIDFLDYNDNANNQFCVIGRAGTYHLIGLIGAIGTKLQNHIDGISNSLRFNNASISKLAPQLYVNQSATVSSFRVYELDNVSIYLNSYMGKFMAINIKNRNLNYTDKEIEEIVKSKFLPVNVSGVINFE